MATIAVVIVAVALAAAVIVEVAAAVAVVVAVAVVAAVVEVEVVAVVVEVVVLVVCYASVLQGRSPPPRTLGGRWDRLPSSAASHRQKHRALRTRWQGWPVACPFVTRC